MNFRTINDLNMTITKNLHRIPDDVDLIVGIPRSGMLVANIIALYLNLPLVDINNFVDGILYKNGATKKRKNWIKNIKDARRILIIDDSSDSGHAMYEAKNALKSIPYASKFLYMAVYVTEMSKKYVDIWFEICPQPRVFEWNYAHHSNSINFCYDIDGVLCNDPTEEENDDGLNYIQFLLNAKIRFQPTFPIGCLITARLEKYRSLTEKWLTINGIQYHSLIMMQFTTKEERVRSGSHGKFKGEIYKKMKSMVLFIESDPIQAEEIASISGKMVFCTGNRMVYPESFYYRTIRLTKLTLRNMAKNIVKTVLPLKVYNLLKKLLFRRK